MRDDAFYHQGPCQVMYPKELVYPRGGGEVSLEMIRAGMDVYQVPVEDGNDSGMDFTCMPGDLIHNAKNLPVYKSRGNVGHHGQQAQVCSSCMHSRIDGIRTVPNTIYHYKYHLVFCHFCGRYLPSRALHPGIPPSTNCCSHSIWRRKP